MSLQDPNDGTKSVATIDVDAYDAIGRRRTGAHVLRLCVDAPYEVRRVLPAD
jgi:hypothetical protein